MSRVPRNIVVSVGEDDNVLFQTPDGRVMRAVRWALTDEGTAAARAGYVCLLCLEDLGVPFADCPICTPCHGFVPSRDQARLFAAMYEGTIVNPEDEGIVGVDREEFDRTAEAVAELNDRLGRGFEERREELGVMTFDEQDAKLERAAWRKKSGIWVPGA